MRDGRVLLSTDSLTKSIDGVHALTGVSFEVRAGEVHAIVGENGAGKSTLIKIMTGAEFPDSGTLSVAGRSLPRMDPATAFDFGIAAVYQAPSLFPHLTVAENLAVGVDETRSWRRVNWNRRFDRARELLARIGSSIEPGCMVETLSMPEQQLVEIARALGADSKVLILDEPTASLSVHEVDALLGVVKRLRNQGVGIVYISHRLEEVLAIADRITVLRDGRSVGTEDAVGLPAADLVRRMVGNDFWDPPSRMSSEHGDVVLAVRHLTSRVTGLRGVSISVRRGEILGLAGLVGSGRTQLAEAIFGITPADEGEILVAGAPVRVSAPHDAVRAGIGYVPEDRRQHGVLLNMSIAANTTLANLASVTRFGLIDRGAECAMAVQYIDQLRIKTAMPLTEVASLSGGNQQKVAVARWLATSPLVLILDEPTQGVDVRSKGEIHRIIQGLANQGLAVILISSDFHELLAMCDRIAVMRQGAIVGLRSRETASRQALLALALGTNSEPETSDAET
jgi:rhamnose transport system ATP-binding protein